MRIGIFTDSYEPIISGVTVSIGVLENELRKLGHEVFIITYEHDHAVPNDHVIRIHGLKVPLKGLKEYKIGKVTRRKVNKFKKYNFDIIHCHTEFTLGRLGRRVAKKNNIPLVHTYHTMYEEYVHFISKTFAKPLRFLSKKFFASFAASADMAIFPTKKVEKKVLKQGYKCQSRVIPTGLYLDDLSPSNYAKEDIKKEKEKLGIKETDFVLLFLGRMSVEKSVEELILNFEKVTEKNIKLLLVGGGPDLAYFQKVVKKRYLEDRVIFKGMVDRKNVGFYYQLGDLFVNFSMTETQGLTYCESLAAGLPLLVKYDDNLEGVIINGINGYSFNRDSEFSMILDTIYKNPIILKEIRSNASKGIEKLSAATYAQNILKAYEYLLKKQ